MNSMTYVPRRAEALVREALADTRVVLIAGARQVGKSTLAAHVLASIEGARSVTLDDPTMRSAARADPTSFIEHAGTLYIDEVQRAPDLVLAIKAAVDRDPRPGKFLLTGSANVLTLPRLADSLVGRVEIVELWPFTQGESARVSERFIDLLFNDRKQLARSSTLDRREYIERAVAGGFPEAVARPAGRRRDRWFESYIKTLIQRDIKELSNIDRLDALHRILRLVAARTSGILNIEGLARDAGVPASSLRRYLELFRAAFLIDELPAWANSRTKRAVRAPKIYLSDSGLAAHLLGVSSEHLMRPIGESGQVIETFAIGELRRQAAWSSERVALHHLRTKEGDEIDAVLETADGRLAAVEVKAGATVTSADFKGMRYVAERVGDRFAGGVVLYSGRDPVSFGPDLQAVPLSVLWEAV